MEEAISELALLSLDESPPPDPGGAEEEGDQRYGASEGSGLGVLRYTDLFVTINSNRSAFNQEDEQMMLQFWKDFMENEIWTKEALEQLIVFYDAGTVRRVDIMEPVVESGPRQHRIHSHFIMSIRHTGKVALGNMLRRWRLYINARVHGFSRGVNVQFQLLSSSRSKNYNLKQQERLGEIPEDVVEI